MLQFTISSFNASHFITGSIKLNNSKVTQVELIIQVGEVTMAPSVVFVIDC